MFFHWDSEKRRDFYFRIADEADVDAVYLGEVACSKREPLFEKYEKEVIKRLQKAGKQVVLSTLAMVTTPREMESIKRKAKSGFLIEANDVAAVQALAGKPFVAGPFINVLNEGTRDYLLGLGAKRIVFASELSGGAIGRLVSSPSVIPVQTGIQRPASAGRKIQASHRHATLDSRFRGNDAKLETEVQVFGRQPLSVSMRCYAARAYGRNKDGCRFACSDDPDGIPVDTVDGQPILTVFGTGTMSHGYVVLLRELKKLQKQGVSHFRLSPQSVDMVKVAALYRAVLNGKKDPESALDSLRKITGSVPFINGYFHAREGLRWVK
ncbi:MAG: U32 family peptidase [Alphaproteobacteria bacterium]|nr:U32 family peptidase [Alphaproteobacteria bacterium]